MFLFALATLFVSLAAMPLAAQDVGRTIYGTDGADTLEGTPFRDYINGKAGDDVIAGGGGGFVAGRDKAAAAAATVTP